MVIVVQKHGIVVTLRRQQCFQSILRATLLLETVSDNIYPLCMTALSPSLFDLKQPETTQQFHNPVIGDPVRSPCDSCNST